MTDRTGDARAPAPEVVADARSRALSAFDAGFFVGILVGEGHFGGDGRQPQVTLRMNTDHAALFAWLMERFPESRLYGPYDHSGRRYYQWMARSGFLRETVVPILDRYLRPEHSARAWQRYEQMKETYGLGDRDDESAPPVMGGKNALGYTAGGAKRASHRPRRPI